MTTGGGAAGAWLAHERCACALLRGRRALCSGPATRAREHHDSHSDRLLAGQSSTEKSAADGGGGWVGPAWRADTSEWGERRRRSVLRDRLRELTVGLGVEGFGGRVRVEERGQLEMGM